MFELGAYAVIGTEIVKNILLKRFDLGEEEKYYCWLIAAVIGLLVNMYLKGAYSVEVVMEGITAGLTGAGAYTIVDKFTTNN